MPFAGNLTAEETDITNNPDVLAGPRIVLTEAGSVTKLHGYRKTTGAGNFRWIVYDDDGGSPPSPVNYEGETARQTLGIETEFSWHTWSFAVALALAKGAHYFCVWGNNVWTSRILPGGAYAGAIHWQLIAYDGAPNPFVSNGSSNNKTSVYIEYRPTKAGLLKRRTPHGGV